MPSCILMVPASLPMPLLAFLDLYVVAFTRCDRVPATLPHMYPGEAGTSAHSAHSVRKATSPSNTRFCTAPLRPTPASPISQVWTTSAMTVPSGSLFPSSEGSPNISTLLARASLQACCAFESILLLLSRIRTQAVLNTKLPGSAPAFQVLLLQTPLLEFLFKVFSLRFMSFLCFCLTAAVGRQAGEVFSTCDCFSYEL